MPYFAIFPKVQANCFVAVPALSSGDVETSMEVATNER